jgi:hypothetical protein
MQIKLMTVDEWIPLEVDDSEVRERNLIASLGYAQRYGAVSAPGATLFVALSKDAINCPLTYHS